MQNNTVVIEHQVIDPVELATNAIDRDQSLKEKIKETKEKLDSQLLADGEYAQLDRNIKEAQQRRKDVKARLMKNPLIYKTADDLKSLKDSRKTVQLTLSDFLIDIEKKTGVSGFEVHGEWMRIEKKAVPKSEPKKKPRFRR
jgi:hypothetical protein